MAADSEMQDFEQMLEASLQGRDNFSVGDKVQGTVVLIDRENIFVDISGKNEAVLAREEFLNDKEQLTIKEGDSVQAYVVSTGRGEIKLTTRIGKSESSPELLELAYQNDIPVEGLVTQEGSGGYTVMVSQNRCFCPFSQMDIVSQNDPQKFLNKVFSFKIIQFEARGKNIVLSRRILLEEKQKVLEQNLAAKLKVGDILTGSIQSIHDFGLFIDMGGVEALVPRSEISYSRNPDMRDFPVGKLVDAKVLSLDWNKKRFSLSIKQVKPDPWLSIDKYKINDIVTAKICNTIQAGAFAELEPGIEGFIHISKLSLTKRIRQPQDAVSLGQQVRVRLSQIDLKNKKIGLDLITGEADPWLMDNPNLTTEIQNGVVETVKNNGLHIRLANGMLGFLHQKELRENTGRDLLKTYPAGKELRVMVTEINHSDRKLFLSEKKAQSKHEQNEYDNFNQSESTSQQSASLGSLFKDQFDKLKKDLPQ